MTFADRLARAGSSAAPNPNGGVAPLIYHHPDGDFPDIRRTLHASDVGCAEILSRSHPNAPARGYANRDEIAIPYAGVFLWRVGRRATAVDANCALFISKGQEFSEAHPVDGKGHAAAIVTPSPDTLEEIVASGKSAARREFETLVAEASPRAQMLAHLLLAQPASGAEALRGDELVIAFLSETLHADKPSRRLSRKVAVKAKTLLHEWAGADFSLSDAARELGVSPVYLTHAFKLAEGVPIYRYFQNLRLAQALQKLPYCNSLTELALELGFSSHSHFSAVFHQRFGIPPSEFRATARTISAPFPRGACN